MDPPNLVQECSLTCGKCGHTAVYDVGIILVGFRDEDASPDEEDGSRARVPDTCFTKYFRCRGCNGAGPFAIHERNQLQEKAGSLPDDPAGPIQLGTTRLFDGTSHQTPALSEEHLLRLIKKEPEVGFLCSRMGNLLRAAGAQAGAIECYERAVLLDPNDAESRYHLFAEARDKEDIRRLAVEAGALLEPSQKVKPEDPLLEKAIVGSVLGSHPLSQAEFEAILGFLERAVKSRWERPVSRNYLAFLREEVVGDEPTSHFL